MNVAEQALAGSELRFDVSADVNETSALVFDAKVRGGKSGVLLIGGGSPKNFVLQTEPQIQEVLGISEKGHDYYLPMTDARPATGALSGAMPAEAGRRGGPPRRGSGGATAPPPRPATRVSRVSGRGSGTWRAGTSSWAGSHPRTSSCSRAPPCRSARSPASSHAAA